MKRTLSSTIFQRKMGRTQCAPKGRENELFRFRVNPSLSAKLNSPLLRAFKFVGERGHEENP